MEQVTFTKVVGFLLAAAFAIVIGVSMWALMVGDFTNTVMNPQTQHTMRIVGFAGMLAAAVVWWCQRFTARRGFIVRTVFALFIFVVAFTSFGALLRFGYIHVTDPGRQDWSLSGLYFASINDFYTVLLDMMIPPRPSYAALILAAAIYVAVFGPREPKTVEI